MNEEFGSDESREIDLVRRIVRRDQAAVGELYDQHAPLLFSLANRILGEQSDAEEVVIEVFAQVWRDAHRFDAARGTLSSWLVTITRSRALDTLRARGRRIRLMGRASEESVGSSPAMGSHTPDPSNRVVANERRQVVSKAMATLSDVQREAIELAYFGGLSQSEIAARLDQPLGTIKTRVRLAMNNLRQALLSYHEPTDG